MCRRHELVLLYWVTLQVKYQKQKLGMRAENQKKKKKKRLETNLALTLNTQADLTHHLLNVHLPLIVRVVDVSKPTHRL